MKTTTRLATTAASIAIAIGLAGWPAQQSTRSAADHTQTSAVPLASTAAAAPLRALADDDVPKPSSKPVTGTPTATPAPTPAPAAALSPGAASAAPTPPAAIPVPSRTTAAPQRAAAPTPVPAPVAAPKPVPAPVAAVSNDWQISISGWARTIVSGTQSAIDACGPAVLYSSSWPGAGGTTWLNGHNNCGFQFWSDLPIGSAVTVTHGPAVFQYRGRGPRLRRTAGNLLRRAHPQRPDPADLQRRWDLFHLRRPHLTANAEPSTPPGGGEDNGHASSNMDGERAGDSIPAGRSGAWMLSQQCGCSALVG